MLLHIDDNTLIADVQEDFSDSFPLLKIEFYDERHSYKDKSLDVHRIVPDKKIGSIRKIHDPGNLEIMSWYTTGRVERNFKEKFGLNVQVFRKEKAAWIQSSSTDAYTLAEQMERARNAVVASPKLRKMLVEYEYL